MSNNYHAEDFEKKAVDSDSELKRKILAAFENDPFFRWSKENDHLMFDGLSFARKAWRDSSKQSRLAILEELERRLKQKAKELYFKGTAHDNYAGSVVSDIVDSLLAQMKKEG